MAVGIDKPAYSLLIARLDGLISNSPDTAQWQESKEELTMAYQRIHELAEEIEQSAVHYQKLTAEIRPKISEEYRRLKKTERKKHERKGIL